MRGAKWARLLGRALAEARKVPEGVKASTHRNYLRRKRLKAARKAGKGLRPVRLGEGIARRLRATVNLPASRGAVRIAWSQANHRQRGALSAGWRR